ncbi:MAG TPA: ABC transporter permease [Longimicrobiales bacterium]|nr:ABC transporter permease [Longimicrobiales bacterium]
MKDVRLSLRRLRREPGFAVVAVVTLALGIGANVGIFSLLNGVALRPLPYAEPGRLVAVWPSQNFNKELAEHFEAASSLEGVSGLSQWTFALSGEGEPERIPVGMVGVDFFDVLGVRPALGRSFLAEEEDPSRSEVVVLSHGFWQRRFDGDPGVIGRVIPLEAHGQGTSRRVVGVLPPDWRSPWQEADAWVPLARPPRTVATDSSWYVNHVYARLAPGVTLERASAEVRGMARRLRAEHPGLFHEDAVARAEVVPLRQQIAGATSRTLWLLFGAVGLVLVIACVNVANLLLARGAGQGPEMAVRKALGASRRRLVRQGVTESVVLGLIGGALGALAAAWGLSALAPELATRLPRTAAAGMDGTVLAFSLGVSLLSAALFGLLPALRNARREAVAGLRSEGRGGTSHGRHRLNRGLVTAETALAVILVAGAGLMANSFWRLYNTDPGFDAEGVLEVLVTPPESRFTSADAQRAYHRELMEAVQAVPGVAGASGIHLLPLTPNNWRFPYLAEGFEPRADQPLPAANFRVVLPDYFELMGIRLVRGRTLTATDDENAEPVGLINRALAERHWPGQDPIGKEVRIFGTLPFRVVGVVENVRQHALDRAPEPEMYRPHAQYPLTSMYLMVRAQNPGAVAALADPVRRAVWSVNDAVPIPEIRPLTDVRAESVAETRLIAGLLAALGVLALLLGAVGVYGVMAYTTRARVHEFGVRLALGASPGGLERTALGWGMAPVLAGLALGAAATLAGSRALSGLLFGVEPSDPATLLTVLLVLTAVAGLATWVPARRVARSDLADTLRR